MNKFLDVIDNYILKYVYYREKIAGSNFLDLNYDLLEKDKPIIYELEKNNEYDKNAIKLFQNNIHIGYIHKNFVQEMINTYHKRKDYKIEIVLNKINNEKEELGCQVAFYQRYNDRTFHTLNRFEINTLSIPNKFYNLKKDKKLNQYYIEENNYVFNDIDARKIKTYIDNNAFVLLRGIDLNTIEVLFII